jgi:hypothetical protein
MKRQSSIRASAVPGWMRLTSGNMQWFLILVGLMIGVHIRLGAEAGFEMKQQPKYVFRGLSADQKFAFGAEWGFMGFIDPDSYQHDIGAPRRSDGARAWTPELILKHAIDAMNHQQGYFWGCGEDEVHIVVNPTNYDDLRKRAVTHHKGFIHVTRNRLCLTGDDRLAMAAQYPDVWRLPMSSDVVWAVPAGWYSIEVLQMFKYDGGVQAPGDEDPRYEKLEIHYAICIIRVDKPVISKFERIPSQASYYRP